jgi:hypothetical protein
LQRPPRIPAERPILIAGIDPASGFVAVAIAREEFSGPCSAIVLSNVGLPNAAMAIIAMLHRP